MIMVKSSNQSEIVHIFEILHFLKRQPYSRFIRKNDLESLNIAVVIACLGKAN